MTILETKNLKKYYGKGDTLVKALDGVNLTVQDGEFVSIVGTSGSGKSTLLHMLGELDRPTIGSVTVDGQDIFSLKDEALTIFRRIKIGFVFQSFHLVPVLTVRENIVLPIQLDGSTVDEEYVRQVVTALGLEKKLNSLPRQLSGGQLTPVIVARLGDTVSLRYVEEFQYYNPDTGEVWDTLEDVPEGTNWSERPTKYRDVEYTVAALVTVPYALSYRYSGDDEFILNDQTFVQDTGTDSIMYYAFDTTDQSNATMEEFLADYTQRINPELDYESKATYAAEFEGMRSMFLLLGGALSFIVGLVGVLNFFNAILTGIIARRRELAVLQAVGMTGRQLRTMLVWEGLLYALGSLVLTLILTLVLGPVTFRALEGLFWFFTYRLNLAPFLLVLPVFALLGAGIPVLTCRAAEKHSVVERLQME